MSVAYADSKYVNVVTAKCVRCGRACYRSSTPDTMICARCIIADAKQANILQAYNHILNCQACLKLHGMVELS